MSSRPLSINERTTIPLFWAGTILLTAAGGVLSAGAALVWFGSFSATVSTKQEMTEKRVSDIEDNRSKRIETYEAFQRDTVRSLGVVTQRLDTNEHVLEAINRKLDILVRERK
jgi:hypothetical protein